MYQNIYITTPHASIWFLDFIFIFYYIPVSIALAPAIQPDLNLGIHAEIHFSIKNSKIHKAAIDTAFGLQTKHFDLSLFF